MIFCRAPDKLFFFFTLVALLVELFKGSGLHNKLGLFDLMNVRGTSVTIEKVKSPSPSSPGLYYHPGSANIAERIYQRNVVQQKYLPQKNGGVEL